MIAPAINPCPARPVDTPLSQAGTVHNLPLPPHLLEQRLAQSAFDITAAEEAGGGVMGAKKLTVTFREDRRAVAAKWKKAPGGGDGWNNSPRREIGVYVVQQLFLDPTDYVVPPVVIRGIPLDTYEAVEPSPSPNLADINCAYGALAAWMINTVQPEKAYDAELFARDPRYAYHFGNLNLLHYLTAHRDARANNFLISEDRYNPRVFSIDNGIAFGHTLYNFFTSHFDKILVDALPRRSIERLRALRSPDLAHLSVLAELHTDTDGILQYTPPGPNIDPDNGNRVVPGRMVQIGLTSLEIAALAERLEQLLSRIDSGELHTEWEPD